MDNLISIENKIKTLEKSYKSALVELKKYYILSETYPNNDEYKNFLDSIKAEIQKFSQSLFKITGDIITKLKNVEITDIKTSNKLEKQKNIHEKLLNMYKDLEQKQNGSSLFINDSKELYNQQYYRNLNLFFGISGLIAFLIYLAKKNNNF